MQGGTVKNYTAIMRRGKLGVLYLKVHAYDTFRLKGFRVGVKVAYLLISGQTCGAFEKYYVVNFFSRNEVGRYGEKGA